MNLPNKLTVLRICMIPIFILVVGLPLDWGQFNVGDTTLAVTQLVGAVIFALASITDWLDGKIARARGLVTNFGKFADPLACVYYLSNMEKSWLQLGREKSRRLHKWLLLSCCLSIISHSA